MVMPNFLIIGAAKSGTSSMYYYLKQHPEIYLSPIKDPKFFVLESEDLSRFHWLIEGVGIENAVADLDSYQALFKSVSNEKAIGEVSTLYLFKSNIAAKTIKHHIPKVKLIAILRNPADRLYSHFLFARRCGFEPFTDLKKVIQEKDTRLRQNWRWPWLYTYRGFSYEQLKPYFEIFNKEQIRIYLYEDLRDAPLNLMQDIFDFLGVNKTFVPDTSERKNVSFVPKHKSLQSLLTKRNPVKSLIKPFIPEKLRKRVVTNLKSWNQNQPPLSADLRKQLVEEYREDILKLQDLIQRDLSKWLEY